MPEVSTLNTATPAPAPAQAPASPRDAILAAAEEPDSASAEHEEAPEEEEEEDEQEQAQQEKQLNALLRKAEKAFCKGNKGLLLSRVECGKWCHAIYTLRQEQGYKDRGFTSQLIFNRLAVHADSKRECDASELALVYKTVELLATGDNWKALTIGKLYDVKKLVQRVEGSEVYGVFDIAK